MGKIKLGKEEIDLDPKALEFSEASINQFLQLYASKYNYYMEKHAEAQYVNSRYSDKYDALYAEKFKEYKELGGSDKLCEAKTLSDPMVQEALEMVRTSKHTANLIYGYLRSLDRAHEHSLQLCYNMRRELSSLVSTVKE